MPEKALPVAIVGMSFRLPGDLGDETAFWDALKQRRDLISQVPADRWAVDELQHDKRSEPGRSITFSAGVLSRIDEFDAGFFGISPREAAWLDPQQRLLLELSWETLENAGIRPSTLAGSDCAVYVGISSLDYGTRGLDDLASMTAHSMTGNTLSVAANRLSYIYDLHGPSVAVDTACSSSLVALHHACNALQVGEASSAMVGGVNLLLHPYPFVGFTKASMLSADGRCRAFDADGKGYVRSEGAAVVLLKPLDKALAAGDRVLAVIRASGVNADGARKTGITIPSAEGQAELMRQVLSRSGLSPADVDFVEAHGTGTSVGDPIEAVAIGSVYGRDRVKPLPVGSVKANLGHLEAASGMAGLVKTVLALRNHGLPPALHLAEPNPHIDFEALNLELVHEYRDLACEDGSPLVAGLNSFGFGGANAHVLLQEFVAKDSAVESDPDVCVAPLILSARSDEALRALSDRYQSLLSDPDAPGFYGVASSTLERRERMEKRLALLASSNAEAASMLAHANDAAMSAGVVYEDALPEAGGVAFVYSGNGSQWCGMGQALLAESPRFGDILAGIDVEMQPLTGFSVVDELRADAADARLDDTVVAQPLLFAIQVAITQLLAELGVRPVAVTGHSVGEVAAAWAAGALDLQQAIRVIVARSVAQGTTRGTGRMAAVGLSESALEAEIAELGGTPDLVIAGVNSPNNVTLSGALADLERLQAVLEPEGVFCRLLDLDYAFHSRGMDPIKDGLLASLDGLDPAAAADATFVSTVTGDRLDGSALGAHYWWRNVREPVRFAQACSRLADLGCRVFLEIGPHAILQRYMLECLDEAGVKGRVLSTLMRRADGPEQLLEAALRTHALVEQVDLGADTGVFFSQPTRRVELPGYPWQRERHWHPETSEGLLSIQRRRVHPLLGWPLPDGGGAWENVLDPVMLPWLADHRVAGATVFPGAGYAEMALAAAREWLADDCPVIEELDILAPMVFDQHARTVRLTVNERDGGFHIRSRQRLSNDEWTLHAAGRVLQGTARRPVTTIEPMPDGADLNEVDGRTHYALATRLGLEYGSAFQGLSRSIVAGERLEVELSPERTLFDDPAYLLHPALLDQCFQSLLDFFQEDIEAGRGVAFLPVKTGRLDIFAHGEVTHFRAQLRNSGVRSVLADFELLDRAGKLLVRADACRFRAAPLLHGGAESAVLWRMLPRLCPHPNENRHTDVLAVRQLIEELRASFVEKESARRVWFEESLPLMEALTLSFAYEAFASVSRDNPGGLHQLADSEVSYVHWLAGILEQEGLLKRQPDDWQLRLEDELPSAEEIWQTLLRENPSCLPQLTLLGRVGRQLPALLEGAVDGRDLLQGLRRSPAAEALYEDDPAYWGTRFGIEHILLELASTWPEERRLRILEMPVGPSELPRTLLHALPEDRLEYVLALSDESGAQRQRGEYQGHPNLSVVQLDPDDWSLDTGEQLPDCFDVVVLRHALHLAASPTAALAQVHRLLAGGGLLLLAERHSDWSANLLAGLDPAWWHQGVTEDGDLTGVPQSSLLAPDTWESLLEEEGFVNIETFTESPAEALAEGAYLVLAKRARREVSARPVVQAEQWLLLCDPESASLAGHLRALLESQGQDVAVSERAHPRDVVGVRHVVHMRGWGMPPDTAGDAVSNLLSAVKLLTAGGLESPRLWVITQGGGLLSRLPGECACDPVQAALAGFSRVVMNELPALRCTLIDLACKPDASYTLAHLENELLHPDGSNEVVLSDTGRYLPTLSPGARPAIAEEEQSPRYRLDFRLPGQLRNLSWFAQPERPLREGEVEVQTRATGLNFRDVMYLMGLLPDEAVEKGFAGPSLGLEFAGVVTRVAADVRDLQSGDAVMGFGASCFASHVVTRANALAQMPDDWSFEAAATVPTVFFTVYYALRHLADLQPGERILIHGGAGGVGIAAIQLARHLGAEVFATAGNDEKRDFVRLLGADQVFDSRSLAFADEILAVTDGEGVDVVLNSLAGEAIRRNLAVLRPFGRFLELGKRDFFENTPIGLRPFKDNISYFGIDADQLLTGRPELAARLFHEVMRLFREGELTPLPYRVFPAERVVDAFRFMQQARHIGKVVVSLQDADVEIEDKVQQAARFCPQKDSTWIVSGGLAGFGLASARWLAEKGVGNLVLLGRRGPDTPGAAEAIAELNRQGVHTSAFHCDVTDSESLATVLERVRDEMPPIKGILHAAMVIDDRLIANLDRASIDAVLRPKLLGAWHLHQASRDIPLDHFVLYSSVTTAIGNAGQANYVAANAGLEGLAEMRRRMGLPATCVAWGAIGDAGYLTRNTAVRDSLEQRLGKPPLSAEEALSHLDEVLSSTGESLTVAQFDWSVLSRLLPSSTSPRFELLNRELVHKGSAEDEIDFRALVLDKSPTEVAELVRALVTQEVAQILCIAPDRIDPARSLHDLGLDSLMAVELAVGLEQRMGIQLPVMMLNESPTTEKVTARILEKLLGDDDAPDQESTFDLVKSMAKQHGEEVSREDIEGLTEDAKALAGRGSEMSG